MSAGRLVALGGMLAIAAFSQAQEPFDPGPPEVPEHISVLSHAASRFREQVIAQSVSIRVITPDGREHSSRVEVLTDPREASRRVAIRLGRALHIVATDDRLRAVSPRNDRDAFEAALTPPLSASSLEPFMPPLPIPHVEWALGGAHPREGEFLVPPLGWFRPLTVERDARREELTIRGSTAQGDAVVVLAFPNSALRRVAGPLPRATPGTRIELTCRDADPEDRRWTFDATGRNLVPSLSLLRPLPAELQPGDLVGGLGLMTPDLTPWSLDEAMREQKSQPTEQGPGPMLAVLILYRTSVPGAEDAAYLACGSMAALKRNLDARRLAAEPGTPDARTSTPRLLVRPVAVFEPAEFTPSGAKELATRWAPTDSTPLWTSAGQTLLDRFERGAVALAIVVDEDLRLLGAAGIDLGPGAGDALLAEVRAIVEESTP